MKPDFSGWATKFNVRCADGRIIHTEAFEGQDTMRVPLVWSHQHDGPQNILGHAILENRPGQGVYTYGFFNDSEAGVNSREAVKHGDITSLSIFANKLIEKAKVVSHGVIREVSLVLAGANPEALIDNVSFAHADNSDEGILEAIIYSGIEGLVHASPDDDDDDDDDNDADDNVEHSDDSEAFAAIAETMDDDQKALIHAMITDILTQSDEPSFSDPEAVEDIMHSFDDTQLAMVHTMLGDALESVENELSHAEQGDSVANENDETVEDVINTLSDKQKDAFYFLLGAQDEANKSVEHSDLNQEDTTMTRNTFDQTDADTTGNGRKTAHLSHSQIQTIMTDAEKQGSLKKAFLAHAGEYGINNIDLLFPDAKLSSNTPEILSRQADWVPKVLGAVKQQPFARVRSLAFDLTAPEARAKGYITGNEKTDEVIELMRRSTSPTTIYKKQKLDRDNVIDITDLDIISWIKWELRFMLNEEIARAILVGDGRPTSSPDKVKDPSGSVDGIGIRSIANDNDLYSVKVDLAANVSAETIIEEVTRARTKYRGSGSPTFYTTDRVLTDLLLLKDGMKRRLYDTEAALASALRVKEIVAVEVMEEYPSLLGIVVNLVDYSVGTDKGGELTMFDDFDIDFNQLKYLLEGRMSGALNKLKSALVIRREQGIQATATAPSFNGATNTISIPTATGVEYLIDGDVVSGDVVITEDTVVDAAPISGYYLESNSTRSWGYTYTA